MHCAVSRWTIWKFVNSGDLKASRTPGGHHRILKEDLEAFILEKEIYPLVRNRSSSNKILIVDDDPQILSLLTKILTNNGYQTETAADGFEAGFKVKEFKPGLIILDLVMPGMDGFEVCKQLKAKTATSQIKILVLSGYDTEENRTRSMQAGADVFLAKSLEAETIVKHVEALLNGDPQIAVHNQR